MYDVVIVGAGSAGCVLASRLTEDKHRSVALIEAGPEKHHSFKVRAPGMYSTLWRTPLDWAFSTVPQQHCNDRRMFWPRGKVVGGTGCLNSLVYIRGHRDNYDEWRDLGNPGWGYSDVLRYFKRSEDNCRGESEYHGAGGLLPVHDLPPSPAAVAFVEATAARCKVEVTRDFNGDEQEGAGAYQHNIRGGVRCSTATAFLDPSRPRKNLTVITDALALGLVLEGTRVRGVRVRVNGRTEVIEAHETILAAGAIGSPHLLMLSGIGNPDELRAVGVEVRHALPGVGKHLEDHLLAGVVYDATSAATRTLSAPRMAAWVLRHLTTRRGPLALSIPEVGAFVRSTPSQPRPDIQFHFSPYGATPPNTDAPRPLPFGRRVTLLPGLIYPKSSGEIRLVSADPAQPPAIDPRYFTDPADLELMVAGVELAREIAATAPLAGLLGKETFPGREVAIDDQLRAYVRASCNTIFHPTGTCKMGKDAMAVVDPQLRVHGLDGLRVADASIMPKIIGGNTNAPTIMIAEKAAELCATDG